MFQVERFLSMFAFAMSLQAALAARAFAGTSRIDPPEPVIDCEWLLTDQQNVASVLKWLREAIVPITVPDTVFGGYLPTEEAYRALGLPEPFPIHAVMRVESPSSPEKPYWLRIYSESGEEFAQFPFHVPPIVVWKQVRDIDDEGETELSCDLYKENANTISAGALLGDFPEGRIFIAVRRRQPNLVTVALGIDVNLRDHKKFSLADVPRFVGTADEEIKSRIEVIKAHFRIPAPVPRRRGGPGHIT